MTRELATLLRAGLPLDRSLEILIDLVGQPTRGRSCSANIRNEVRGGASLSKALEAQKGVFSRFYVNMIRAGEAGGSLPDVLARLAEYHGARQGAARQRRRPRSPIPAILAVVVDRSRWSSCSGVVVPHFEPIFARRRQGACRR